MQEEINEMPEEEGSISDNCKSCYITYYFKSNLNTFECAVLVDIEFSSPNVFVHV